MADAADVIISVRRDYADAILAGTKTVELRRKLPPLLAGTRLWIYATQPTGAVVGFATVRDVERAAPVAIWRRHRASTGIKYDAFLEYFDGAPEAIAILIAAAQRIGPITIEQLRQIRDRFHPPQVVTRLTAHESRALLDMVSA